MGIPFSEIYNFKNPTFKKIFLTFLITTVLSIGCTVYFSLKFSVENINNQVSVSFMHLLNSKKEAIDKKIIEVDNIIYQVMMDKNVWMLLRSAEINESHLWPIRDIIDDFTSIANTNESRKTFTNKIEKMYKKLVNEKTA